MHRTRPRFTSLGGPCHLMVYIRSDRFELTPTRTGVPGHLRAELFGFGSLTPSIIYFVIYAGSQCALTDSISLIQQTYTSIYVHHPFVYTVFTLYTFVACASSHDQLVKVASISNWWKLG